MTDDTSARLRLPFLQSGQAQKELYHNEALALIDIAVQPAVLSVGANEPPANPRLGECWVVGTAPTGVWSGQAGTLAGWTAGGWRFLAPIPGMSVWSQAQQMTARYDSAAWLVGQVRAAAVLVDDLPVLGARQPAIQSPQGGTAIDAESRSAILAILAALRSHGLIAT